MFCARIRIALFIVATVVLLLGSSAHALARATVVSGMIRAPLDSTWPVTRCDGTSELVTFTGAYLLQYRSVTDANGNVHTEFHVNGQGIQGVGLESGMRYVEVTTYQESSSVHYNTSGGEEYTIVTITQLIAQEEGTLYERSLFYRTHFTLTPKGEVAAQHEVLNEQCA